MSSAGEYEEHWYEIVEDDSLRQGDVFRDLIAYWPPDDLECFEAEPPSTFQPVFKFERGDFIIASASCDLDQPGYPYAILARVLPASSENLKATGKELEQKLEVIRLGLLPVSFLLAPYKSIEPSFPLSIVQHKVHALLPTAYVRRCCSRKRLRLRHPLREKFGNWVGSSFSRVGPEDQTQIPKKATIFPAQVLKAQDT